MPLRRFRTRTLLSITLIGVGVLVIIFTYSPASFLRNRIPEYSSNGRWWGRLWSRGETCDVDPSKKELSSAGTLYTGDVYPQLDFKVPDNGVGFWNELLESRYREIKKTWKTLPLEVIVVPQSHVDPGWLRTYEDYFDNSITHILDNMVNFLNKTEDFKFIWAEISYFSKWWEKQNKVIQETVRKILKRKQLEFVTGGWVMVDEATTSYFAIIDQLIEGHQWLEKFTNFTPHHGWSVDVFGHSASLPYILSLSGMTNMVILRAHYSWKAFLAQIQSFDFYWEQQFNSPKIMCHMAPSDLYSFKHTCGPDSFLCLKYDFRKIIGEMSESTADEITDQNVELKASYLLTQYGRYASLFNHSVLLVPLGDDFRYNVYTEWEQQYRNYKKLFDYINGKKDWNARVRFGTVEDYFVEVHKRLQNYSHNPVKSISGDFLPYGDVYANARPSYWTGFYTTRPFFKKLARELEHWLRSAEILYSLAKTNIKESEESIFLKDYSSLITARRNLALFQHHDAITGTSKRYVMEDYGRKLHVGITNAMSVASHMTQILVMKRMYEGNTWTSQVYSDVYRTEWNKPTKKLSVLTAEMGRKIIFFNSLTTVHTEVVRLRVRSTHVMILDSEGNVVPSQINPTWKDDFTMSSTVFELVFVITLKPLSFSTYCLKSVSPTDSNVVTKSVISLFLKDDSAESIKNSAFKFEKPKDSEINLESSSLQVKFSPTGILKEIYMKESGITKSVDIDFRAYRPWLYRSGAYLFQPDSPNPIPISNLTDQFPFICAIRGPVVSELNLIYQSFFKFTVRLYHYDGAPSGLQMDVSSDISKLNKDVELIMRINSDINNNGAFYTDSNGFQMLKRTYASNLPVQGNYYPATSNMYIEDHEVRLNLLIPHSHGVTSPSSGTMEIMLDRKISNDDGRGMSEGVEDSQMVARTFWLVPEVVTKKHSQSTSLSSQIHTLSLCAQYPIITFITDNGEALVIHPELSFLSEHWPSDVHLINLRSLPMKENYTLPSNSSLMVIYEKYGSCKMHSFIEKLIKKPNGALFSTTKVESIVKTSLTGTDLQILQHSNATFGSKLQTYKITFS
ncbi:alpha-mannosidase 2 [Caerostris extrusa]|uniref:Alpha-mannosidase n=1 Tax=Caerostris extrusa TaxID=172846 RepID=A0AAV4XIP8_CAEEX|nr:alpha-mannosidase 2 [Caerostris extrusa]